MLSPDKPARPPTALIVRVVLAKGQFCALA
jgi:hypothetical protein